MLNVLDLRLDQQYLVYDTVCVFVKSSFVRFFALFVALNKQERALPLCERAFAVIMLFKKGFQKT